MLLVASTAATYRMFRPNFGGVSVTSTYLGFVPCALTSVVAPVQPYRNLVTSVWLDWMRNVCGRPGPVNVGGTTVTGGACVSGANSHHGDGGLSGCTEPGRWCATLGRRTPSPPATSPPTSCPLVATAGTAGGAGSRGVESVIAPTPPPGSSTHSYSPVRVWPESASGYTAENVGVSVPIVTRTEPGHDCPATCSPLAAPGRES